MGDCPKSRPHRGPPAPAKKRSVSKRPMTALLPGYARGVATFLIAGRSVELDVDTVRRRLRGVAPEPIQVWGVNVDGTLYPVVQALEVASGVPRGATRSARARSVLGALGFQVTRLDEPASFSTRRGSNVTPDVAPPALQAQDGWSKMDARQRHPVPTVRPEVVPKSPGVYAFYREGDRIYVGRAIAKGGLRKRLCGMHLLIGPDVSWSAFRRNVAETQGVPTSVTRVHRDTLTVEQLERLNQWVAGCEVAWIECGSAAEATALEASMKAEYKPMLTKR